MDNYDFSPYILVLWVRKIIIGEQVQGSQPYYFRNNFLLHALNELTMIMFAKETIQLFQNVFCIIICRY